MTTTLPNLNEFES